MSRQLDMLDECLRIAKTFDLRCSVHNAPPIHDAQPPARPRRRRRRRAAAALDLRWAVATGSPDLSAAPAPSVESVVISLVAHAFRVSPQLVRPESRLGGWCVVERGPDFGESDLDRVQLVLDLQERVQRSFKDIELDGWHTVADIIQSLGDA